MGKHTSYKDKENRKKMARCLSFESRQANRSVITDLE